MAVQEVRLDGVEVEPSTGFVHQGRQTRRGVVRPPLADPLDRFLQADLEMDIHSDPPRGELTTP